MKRSTHNIEFIIIMSNENTLISDATIFTEMYYNVNREWPIKRFIN